MENLHRYFLINPEITFLNHGSFGATPEPVFNEYQKWQRELEHQPVEFLDRRFAERMSEARAVLADYLNTRKDNLVFVTNATVGVNIIAQSMILNPGDEVLTTNHEYGACDRIWKYLIRKKGFSYLCQNIPVPILSEQSFLERLWEGVTPRTKIIFLSHITSSTALILPVKEVCRRARDEGILTIVDGAHVPGHIPLNVEDIGADFYTGNFHKWLCSPKGAGFLFARPENQRLLEPLVVSWGYEAEKPGPSKFVDHHEYWGTRDLASFLSVPAAIEFQKLHNWERVQAACHDLVRAAEVRIRKISGLPSLYIDDSWYGQMATAQLHSEINTLSLKKDLYEKFRIEIPVIEWNNLKLIRISIQAYNDKKDVDNLINALNSLSPS